MREGKTERTLYGLFVGSGCLNAECERSVSRQHIHFSFSFSKTLSFSFLISLVFSVLRCLKHSSGLLKGRLPHSFPLHFPFLLSSPGLKIGQLIIKQSRRASFTPWRSIRVRSGLETATPISTESRDRIGSSPAVFRIRFLPPPVTVQHSPSTSFFSNPPIFGFPSFLN